MQRPLDESVRQGEEVVANHPSAEKRHRQSLKRRARHRVVRDKVRDAVKDARLAIAAGDRDKATTAVRSAEAAVRRGRSRGTYKRQTADRLVSRLARALWRM
jgi:small subunit ribosomal protein S20